MATDDMWDDGDGEMGWKDGKGLGKYRQGTTTNLRAYRRSMIVGMEDKVSDGDSGGRAWRRRCGTAGIDMAAAEMREVKRRDVGAWRWRNGLEERRWTGQILTDNNYQTEGVSSL